MQPQGEAAIFLLRYVPGFIASSTQSPNWSLSPVDMGEPAATSA